jgi:hypothetical protein
MEHDVYICEWAETPEGFEVWVRSRPHVRARDKTATGAELALIDAIVEAGGAYHPVMEFVPPLPQTDFDQKYATPELYTIVGDDRFETDEPRSVPFETDEERIRRWSWYDDFFTAPCCRVCRSPAGPRNERPLTLTHVRNRFDGGFVVFSSAFLHVFSENFLASLSKHERELLQFRLVKRQSKSRKQYFELIGPSGPPEVVIAGRELQGWQCVSCEARTFSHVYSPDVGIGTCIAREDLPNPLPSVFTIGTQPNVSLCVTGQRWASIAGTAGTRGLVSRLVGVVPDGEVIRNPELAPRASSRGT